MVEAVLLAATVERPGRAVAFPHRGEEDMRILRVENDVDAAGAVVEIENFFPRFAAIARAEDAALRVSAVGMAEGSDEGDIGIGRMDNDGADVAGVFQADVVPGFAAIVGTIDAITEGDVAADASFATAHVDDIRIRIGDGNGANRGGGLLLEERIPGVATVGGFPNAAGDSAKIESVRLARHTGDGQRASATEGTDEAPFHAAIGLGVNRIDRRGSVGGFGRFGWLGLLSH